MPNKRTTLELDRSALDALKLLLQDPDPGVRLGAVELYVRLVGHEIN